MNAEGELRSVLYAIRMHCRDCMGGQPGGGARCETRTCKLRQYSEKPLQVDMADGLVRNTWMAAAVEAVLDNHSAAGAWWSEMRRSIEDKAGRPWSNAWWGGVATRLRECHWSQQRRRTCTELKQRNKASEWFWAPPAKDWYHADVQQG